MVYRILLWPYKRSGRPVEVAIPETIEKQLADRILKVWEIVEAIGISNGSVVSILKDHLGMKKLTARRVQRLLTVDHKRNRVTTSIECLALFNRNKDEFLRRFVTISHRSWFFTVNAMTVLNCLKVIRSQQPLYN